MSYDLYKELREQATILECGLKVYQSPPKDNGHIHLMIWQPKALKPFFNYLVKPENVQNRIDQFVTRLEAHKEQVAKYKEERKGTKEAWDRIQVGSIFRCSWGYEQTNVDYYQVIEIKKSMIKIHSIASEAVPDSESSWCSNRVRPIKDKFLTPRNESEQVEWTKKVLFTKNEPFLKIESYAYAYLWNGEENYCSWGY